MDKQGGIHIMMEMSQQYNSQSRNT